MDEQNPNAVLDDSDYESYLSILQKMQDSLPEEEVSASFAQPDTEDEEDFPAAPTLLATAELSAPALLEPDFDAAEMPVMQDVLVSNGHSHSFDGEWGAMPTQPLSLPSEYLNGSSFAQYNIPVEAQNSVELDVPAPSFDEDDSLVEMEAPTDFALSAMGQDLNGTVEAFAPSFDEDDYEEPATQLLQPISPEIAEQFAHSSNGNSHSDNGNVEMPDEGDFALPTMMLVQEEVSTPEPDFAAESVVENEFDEFATQPLPDIMFALSNNSIEETIEEPEMLLVETPELTAEDEVPALDLSEEAPQLEADEFEMPEMLDALPTPMAFSGFSNSETALPEPESLDEFPSFIAESDEFPESLESADADAPEFDEPFAPAFESFDVPTVLPNDFTNNGKYDYAAEQTTESVNGTEASVKTHIEVDSSAFLEDRYIVFKIDESLYAFSAKNVAEIGQPLPVTPLPFVPSWFLGISNLRGDILSVVGLRELWNKKSSPLQQRTKLLVVRSERQGVTVGLVVDAVREMRRVNGGEISAGNRTEEHFSAYKLGEVDYDGQRLSLLDAEKFLETLKG